MGGKRVLFVDAWRRSAIISEFVVVSSLFRHFEERIELRDRGNISPRKFSFRGDDRLYFSCILYILEYYKLISADGRIVQ